MSWVMLSELHNSQVCHSLVEQEIFLKKVNDELDDAFDKGLLQKDDNIQLVSSMGGRTFSEILNLRKIIGITYRGYVILSWNTQPFSKENRIYYENENDAEIYEDIYRDVNLLVSKFSGVDIFSPNIQAKAANQISDILLKLYSAVNCVLVIFAFSGVFLFLKKRRKVDFSSDEKLTVTIIIAELFLSLVLCLAISWFVEFILDESALFYATGMLPMLSTFEICGTWLFFNLKKTFSF